MTEKKTPARPVERVSLSLDRSGGADPSQAAASDISTIVAQYKKNGTMPAVTLRTPLYGDFRGPEDLHEMREKVFDAQDRFLEFPAEVRDLCNNDMVQFLQLMETEEGQAELINAGLEIIETPSEPTTLEGGVSTPQDPPEETPSENP